MSSSSIQSPSSNKVTSAAQAQTYAVPVITVDGPSGSGKGTICTKLAAALGWVMLDSGALYRIVGWAALEKGIEPDDAETLVRMIAGMDISFPLTDAGFEIRLGSRVLKDELRAEPVSIAASKVAALPTVRSALLSLQRGLQKMPGLIADGRDMGTVVFPQAALKIFLTASAEQRAQRRYKQLIDKGLGVSLRALLASIEERDERDRTRTASPLIPATDAIVVDSTHLSIEAVVQQILKHVEQRGLLVKS